MSVFLVFEVGEAVSRVGRGRLRLLQVGGALVLWSLVALGLLLAGARILSVLAVVRVLALDLAVHDLLGLLFVAALLVIIVAVATLLVVVLAVAAAVVAATASSAASSLLLLVSLLVVVGVVLLLLVVSI